MLSKSPPEILGHVDAAERCRLVADLDGSSPLEELLAAAAAKRDAITGATLSYSPKVFIDLTRLCRDKCRYCTFVRMPLSSRGETIRVQVDGSPHATSEPKPYLDQEEVLAIAMAGQNAGCREALFTLGDRPEERYESARVWLRQRGYDSTAEYLQRCAELVVEETGLLPHLNPGVMTAAELAEYRRVSVSSGLMLETSSRRLFEEPTGCHFGSPDKDPEVRIESIREAGKQRIPFTTGVLIGIGETYEERLDSLLTIASIASEFGHIQEVIIQNFRAKATIPMRNHPEPGFEEMLRTVAVARLLLPDSVAVQAPPNLSPGSYPQLVSAGLSDWGGISPVTPDHVNPEAPWPAVAELSAASAALGFELRARLPVYPPYVTGDGWIDDSMIPAVEAVSDAEGWAA